MIIQKNLNKTRKIDEELYNLWKRREDLIRSDPVEGLSKNSTLEKSFEDDVLVASECLDNYKYHFTNRLGGGSTSFTYTACKLGEGEGKGEDDCRYIARVTPIQMPYRRFTDEIPSIASPEDFLNEAKLTQLMGELGIGPMVYDFRICNGDNIFFSTRPVWLGLMIAQKLDKTFDQFLEDSPELEFQAVKILNHKIEKMAHAGFQHNDIRGENIMIQQDPFDVFFIDFERMIPLNSDAEKRLAIKKMKEELMKLVA